MKKFVAILIAAIMLVSLVPSTFAAPATDYYADMSGRYRVTYPGTNLLDSEGVFTQFDSSHIPENSEGASNLIVSGDQTLRKNADDKIVMGQLFPYVGSKNFSWLHNSLKAVPFTYTTGEKAYVRAQYYIPSVDPNGVSYEGYNDNFTMHMLLLGMEGVSGDKVLSINMNSATGGNFYVRGDTSLATNQTWSFDEWFTVEAIVTFGSNATMSLYLNGNPLTFTGGSPTNSENISLGATTKVTSFNPFSIGCKDQLANARKRVIYSDNWAYESYEASETVKRWTPPVYNPIAFDGFTDGSKIDIKTFTQATVTVGREECTEVSLSIDGESLGTLTAPPYTFNIPSSVELGNAIIKAVAKTATETFERSVNVVLTEIYARKAMDQSMDSYGSFLDAANGGWYDQSARFSLSGMIANGWYMKPEVLQDKAKKSYGKAIVFGCDPNSGEYYYEQGKADNPKSYLNLGYKGLNATDKKVSGYTATLDWQMYVNNANMDANAADAFCLKTGQKLYSWDNTEKKLKWNVKGDPVYTEPKYQYWQNYVVDLDMTGTTTKMSLTIDGVTIFEDAEMGSNISEFDVVRWDFDPDHTLGNYVAVDEVKLTHYIPRPGFGEATFYRGEAGSTDLENISSLTDTITIDMGKDLMPNLLDEYVKFYENGEELTFVDDEGETQKTNILLYNGLLYLVAPCPLLSDTEYSVFLDKNALFADSAKIGYDQTFKFTTAKADVDVMNVTYYKNGDEITDLSAVTFAAGDKIKAEVTVCNANTLDEDLYVMLLGYNDTRLAASDITSVTAVAEKADNVFETAEITITDPVAFSASVAVWNGDFLPIANATIASGNQ